MNFKTFATAVAKQFQSMIPTGLFRVDVEKDALWNSYLGSFPPGSNPIYKDRTEHDCNSCKHFIRVLGGVVTIQDGKRVSIWDIEIGDEYRAVADAMALLVKGRPMKWIADLWCRMFHGEPMLPFRDEYECRRCQRRYPVRWGSVTK